MNLRDLRYALALADHGHFGRAAEACGISQPTLSGQVRKLEDELGVALFERAGRRLRVTPHGEAILARAREAVAASDEIVRIADAGSDPLAGPLRLGMIPTIAPYLLPLVLPLAQRELPAMPLAVSEEPTDQLLARVDAGDLDGAVLATAVPAGDLLALELYREPLLVALPDRHPRCSDAAIVSNDLAGESLLLLADGHCLREQALAICTSARTPSSDLRATSLETLLNLVEADYGLTVVPALGVASAKRRGGRVQIRAFAPSVERPVSLVLRRASSRRRALEALATVIRAATRDRVSAWVRGEYE